MDFLCAVVFTFVLAKGDPVTVRVPVQCGTEVDAAKGAIVFWPPDGSLVSIAAMAVGEGG